MSDRPTADAIDALRRAQAVGQREVDEVAESIASDVEQVVRALHNVRGVNVSSEIDSIGQHGFDMVAAVRHAFDEVERAIQSEVGALQQLLRDGSGEASTNVATTSVRARASGRQFENMLPAKLASELAHAERHGVYPVRIGGPEFDEIVNSGTVKWVVLSNGDLLVMRKHLDGVEDDFSHAVLSRGGPVLAAGQADIVGSAETGYFGLAVSNHSGHYEPPPDTLEIGVEAFDRGGIPFAEEGQERIWPT